MSAWKLLLAVLGEEPIRPRPIGQIVLECPFNVNSSNLTFLHKSGLIDKVGRSRSKRDVRWVISKRGMDFLEGRLEQTPSKRGTSPRGRGWRWTWIAPLPKFNLETSAPSDTNADYAHLSDQKSQGSWVHWIGKDPRRGSWHVGPFPPEKLRPPRRRGRSLNAKRKPAWFHPVWNEPQRISVMKDARWTPPVEIFDSESQPELQLK